MTDKIFEEITNFFKAAEKTSTIGLQNFQGIREYTEIPFAPLTLVYGQNSAGKSTLVDALEFISNFFSGKLDEELTNSYLARWANHNRISTPLTKKYKGLPEDVIISVSGVACEQDHWDWEDDYFYNDVTDKDSLSHKLFAIDADIPFSLSVYFSNESNIEKWVIRKYTVALGGIPFIDFEIDDYEYQFIKFNKSHVVFSFINKFIRDSKDSIVNNLFIDISDDPCWAALNYYDVSTMLVWKSQLNWSDQHIDFTGGNKSTDFIWFKELIDCLFMMLGNISSDTHSLHSVPPLRVIPSKDKAVYRVMFSPFKRLSENCWTSLASSVANKFLDEQYPDIYEDNKKLHLRAYSLLNDVNRILSHPMFLNTDYEISGDCFLLTPFSVLKKIANKTDKEVREMLMEVPVEIHLKLRHKSNGCLVDIEDVGVGISQVVPVIFGLLSQHRVFIQQPELHLHPKLQAQLADAFIEAVYKNKSSFPCFIVESHSEHFLLRVLRRIRETHKSDIKNKLFSLYAEQVSVIYVDKKEDGSSKIFPLRISPEGEFIDRWPNGFFTERDGELFDE